MRKFRKRRNWTPLNRSVTFATDAWTGDAINHYVKVTGLPKSVIANLFEGMGIHHLQQIERKDGLSTALAVFLFYLSISHPLEAEKLAPKIIAKN